MNKSIFLFIGPQGCGKGTQGKKLAQLRNIPHREMSALLAESDTYDPENKMSVSKVMTLGGLVADAVVVRVFMDALKKNNWSEVVVDGFPRKVGQARAATDLISQGYDVQVVVFELDDEECLRRIKGRIEEFEKEQERRVQQGLPPLKARGDEDIATQLRRLKFYRENQPAIMEHLNSVAKSRVHQIDARAGIEEVFRDILSALPLLTFNG